MAQENIQKLLQLLDNMEQIEKFFCDNCSNDNCTSDIRNECTLAFAILAKNTSWGFVLEEFLNELNDHHDDDHDDHNN